MKLPAFSLFCVLGLLFQPALRAAVPDDFAGLKWGTKPEAAQAAMLAKPGVALAPATPEAGAVAGQQILQFTGGTLAGHPAATWRLRFDESGLIGGAALLTPGELRPEKLTEAYEQLKKSLNQKYREPGREERDRAFHKATYWKFENSRGQYAISCDVNTPGIKLSYSFTPKAGPGGAVRTKKDEL